MLRPASRAATPPSRARGRSRPPWLLAALACAVTFLIYAGTTDRDNVVNDVSSGAIGAWHIAETGKPWFADDLDLEQLPHRYGTHAWVNTTVEGHRTIFRSPGAIAAGVPAYAVARLGTEPVDFSITPAALWAALLATVALALLALSLRGLQRSAWTVAAVAVLAFGTPVWSINADGLWTHATTIIGIAGMAWASRTERWWLVGVFGGIGLWGRLHVALIVAIVGLVLALWRRMPGIALRVGLASGAFLALATCWSRWVYGVWAPQGSYPSGSRYLARTSDATLGDQLINQLGLWVSPDRGVLVWTPLLVILFPAVVRNWRTLPDWSRALVVGGLAYALVQGQLNGFTGGSGFYGYRLTLETLVCVFPAYALSAHRAGRVAGALIGPVAAVQIGAIAIGAISNGFFLTTDRAWTDNSLALALRHVPALWGWMALAVLIGLLATAVWRQRLLHSAAPETCRCRALASAPCPHRPPDGRPSAGSTSSVAPCAT